MLVAIHYEVRHNLDIEPLVIRGSRGNYVEVIVTL